MNFRSTNMKAGNRILSTHQITYTSNGFVQTKYLVSKKDWYGILKPIKDIIAELDSNSLEVKHLKDGLRVMFGDYNICFCEGGLLHQSMQTGVISLPQDQGGNHSVTWKKLK